MIQPGQKLKEGDYCSGVTFNQARELMSIENENYPSDYETVISDHGIVFSDELGGLFSLLGTKDYAEKEYNFADFKQLCENTFGDGN